MIGQQELKLIKVLAACRRSRIPDDLFNLLAIHRMAPQTNALALVRIDQAMDELAAFRDDVHIAAWKPLMIDAHAWELFTFLWKNEVKTAGEMAAKAANRGHSVEDYEAALNDLSMRGWIKLAHADEYRLTELGQTVRTQVEDDTNRFLYEAWSVLSADETAELGRLLNQLDDTLKRMTENVAV